MTRPDPVTASSVTWKAVDYDDGSDERYRYLLDMQFYVNGVPKPGELITVVGKNPSKATEFKDDPTTRNLRGWVARNDIGRVRLVNLFAWRSDSPRDLDGPPWGDRSLSEAVGDRNDEVIARAAAGSERVVAAWGGRGSGAKTIRDVDRYHRRIEQVVDLIGADRWSHIGRMTAKHYPLHPFRWNGLSQEVWLCHSACTVTWPAACSR